MKLNIQVYDGGEDSLKACFKDAGIKALWGTDSVVEIDLRGVSVLFHGGDITLRKNESVTLFEGEYVEAWFGEKIDMY